MVESSVENRKYEEEQEITRADRERDDHELWTCWRGSTSMTESHL